MAAQHIQRSKATIGLRNVSSYFFQLHKGRLDSLRGRQVSCQMRRPALGAPARGVQPQARAAAQSRADTGRNFAGPQLIARLAELQNALQTTPVNSRHHADAGYGLCSAVGVAAAEFTIRSDSRERQAVTELLDRLGLYA